MAVASRPPARQAPRAVHQREVVVGSPESAQIAKRLVYSPLTILVEDREADGVLLEIVVEKLASQEFVALWKTALSVAPAGLEMTTAGGVNAMPDRIRRLAAEPSRKDCLRLVVFCDSDKRWPTDVPQSAGSIAELTTACAEMNVQCHVLQKRTAENYIPDEVFEAACNQFSNSDVKVRFEAIFRRDRTQRDHFPIKDGMSDEERGLAIAAGLYSEAEMADLELLKRRVFNKRPRLMLQVQQNHLDVVTAAGLQARDGAGELENLLARIAAEL